MSEDKQQKIDEFLQSLRRRSVNVNVGGFDDMFTEKSAFRIVCINCLSLDIEVELEEGTYWSEWTGSDPDTLMCKCRSCGTAETVYR